MKEERRNRRKFPLRGFLILGGLILLILFLVYLLFPKASLPERVAEDVCGHYGISFDTTSIETIYLHPESILADPDKFLQQDTAYLMLAQHRARTNDPFPVQAWVKDIEKLAAQSEENRLQQMCCPRYSVHSLR